MPPTVKNASVGTESNSEDDDWGLDDGTEKRDMEDEFRDYEDKRQPRAWPHKKSKRSPLPPMGFQGAMMEARRLGDTTFTFPVAESFRDGDEPQWEPLPLKTLKELQSAVKTVGASAPYTLQVLDMVASLWLTPYDWHQTAKATLSPGDYILWRTEYEDRSKETIVNSMKKRGGIKPTMSMLLGTNEYATPQSQTTIPKDILESITHNAVSAWRNIPPPGTKGGALAGIRQGMEESYQDFISRLEEAIYRMLPQSEGTEILLKQLAWENANTLCQDLIRPMRKTGTIQDYIKACVDASPAIVQGMAYAAAMKGQKFSAYVKRTYGGERGNKESSSEPTCYNCGKPGHLQKECRKGKGSDKKGAPGLCPRCRKGKHWRSECKSKFHRDGTPLGKDDQEDNKERSKN